MTASENAALARIEALLEAHTKEDERRFDEMRDAQVQHSSDIRLIHSLLRDGVAIDAAQSAELAAARSGGTSAKQRYGILAGLVAMAVGGVEVARLWLAG